MSADSTRQAGDSNAAQQRLLSLLLRSEREIFLYVAALVTNVTDAEDIVQQTAISLWEKFDAYDPSHSYFKFSSDDCEYVIENLKLKQTK